MLSRASTSLLLKARATVLVTPWTRGHRTRDLAPSIRELNRRSNLIATDQKLRQGHQTVPKRSEFLEWNYNVELRAFSARVREEFDSSKLREAFLDPSYVDAETRRRERLGLEMSLTLTSNSRLSELGLQVLQDNLCRYLRAALPFLPEECVGALVRYLSGVEVLSDVSFHLGTKDLIMSEEYPPKKETFRRTFLAVLGAVHESSGPARSYRFAVDFVAARLHGEDLSDIIDVKNPMNVLATILSNQGRGEPNSRLLWESGKDTLLACFHVGIYSDKELIGQSPGETAEIAEEMAAVDALRRLFRLDHDPLPFGDRELQRLESLEARATNPSLAEWVGGDQPPNVTVIEEQ